MGVEYRPASRHDYEAIRRFLSGLGWEHRVGDPIRFEKMMDATGRATVAFEGGLLVGFARALCDGVSNGYISMVAVAPDKRGQGIGRDLIARLIGEDDQITWVLRADRDSEGFWQKIGFAASEVAMERTRKNLEANND